MYYVLTNFQSVLLFDSQLLWGLVANEIIKSPQANVIFELGTTKT